MAKATRYTAEMTEEYTKKGYWKNTTLSDFWDMNAKSFPDKEALVDSRTRLTWSQAKQIIDRLALGFLDLGIGRDEMIVLQLPPMAEAILLRVACEKAGILSLPAARTLREAEMEYVLNRTRPAGLVIFREFAGFNYFNMLEAIRPRIPEIRHVFIIGEEIPGGTLSLKEIMERPLGKTVSKTALEERTFTPFETSLVVHTTGTTGMPKLVQHAMCSKLWHGSSYIEKLALTGDDILGLFAPVAAGPNTPAFFTAPQIGAKVVILERWDTEAALKLIARERISAAFFVPTMLINMVNHPNFQAYDLGSLRVVWTGGAPIPYHQAVEVEKKLGCPLLQHYGSVDSDVNTINSPDDPQELRMSSVGKPLAETEIRLADEDGSEAPEGGIGEVWGRGPACGPGYFGDEEMTRREWEGGWFKMGDLARWEGSGNLVIVGRKKDMIIRGGQNIYPDEVEAMLRTYPSVADATIVGMPDPIMGQRCCAYVVLQPGKKIVFEEMTSFLKAKKFAPYKLPERLEIITALPRVGDQQKVDKKTLERDVEQKLKDEGKI
ncbi:MAG: AMP-binding protein [Desulfobacterales bacterium]|nr:AMP-binding protein [Desulfobacterales bacterium]